jgi:hypothetical protein
MPNRLFSLLVACNATFIIGCFGSPDNSTGTPPPTDPKCQLNAKNEKSPGYPFDVAKFTSDVLPLVAKSCGAQGCHGAPAGNGGFIVWADAKAGDCNFAQTFNNVTSKLDLTTPDNSQLLTAVTGGDAAHPFKFPPGDAGLTTLKSFVSTAAAAFAKDGGGVTAPPGASPFDPAVYQSTIQPMFESCAVSGCHGTGAGGFTLKPSPAPGSADLNTNFVNVTSFANLATPASSLIYVQATTIHAGGLSKVIDSTQAQALLAWITTAKMAGGNNTNPTCAPVSKFNAGTFASQVLPILSGALDLNQAGGVGRGAGCMSTACHGTDRGPGKLSILPTADTATQLQNFACFVSLNAPSSSEVLACPTNTAGCRVSPHPGQDVLQGANDLNYQALLAFIFGAQTDVSPLDFAFYVRKINPIFDNVASVQGGALGITCADNRACHGISVAGQAPPNGSNFPILTNASGLDRLTVNFVSATGFVNFLNPNESSLSLYPTNEIADRANHPFATGIDHPGGLDFAVDSAENLAITQWAAGLRPDGQGFQRNWLVVGDFPATLISDQTLIDETTVTPQIFDRGGGSFNVGQWDGLFSNSANVDLNQSFPRAATGGRVGYAVSYALNTVPRQIQAQLTIATNNPVRVYIDGLLVAQNDQSGGTTAFMNLQPAGGKSKPTRILIKVLQRANDAQFAFTAQLKDQNGVLLTDATRELVFTLGLNGGI